jgi:hypothetical protein
LLNQNIELDLAELQGGDNTIELQSMGAWTGAYRVGVLGLDLILTLLAGVHETKRRLWLSRDGGMSWNDIGRALPEESHFSSAPLVLAAERFLLGACGWGDGTCGVLASDDVGQSWTSKSSEALAGQPLWMKDGHLVWPAIYGSGAILSADLGESWTKGDGPRSTPVELPNGRIVAVGGDQLVISSGTTIAAKVCSRTRS